MHAFFDQFRPKAYTELDKYTYQDFKNHFESREGGLLKFLIEVPPQILNQALRQKERIHDEKFKANNSRPAFRQNVASFTVDELKMACNQYGIYIRSVNNYGKIPLNDHPSYGLELLRIAPEKYFLAKSQHQSHFKRLDQLYSQQMNAERDQRGESYEYEYADQQDEEGDNEQDDADNKEKQAFRFQDYDLQESKNFIAESDEDSEDEPSDMSESSEFEKLRESLKKEKPKRGRGRPSNKEKPAQKVKKLPNRKNITKKSSKLKKNAEKQENSDEEEYFGPNYILVVQDKEKKGKKEKLNKMCLDSDD